jgi:ABC-type xylose transport system permease subunit
LYFPVSLEQWNTRRPKTSGGNDDAARAAGINVDKVIWSAFVFAALLAGLAVILMTGRLDSAVTTQGQGIIFSAFAAAVEQAEIEMGDGYSTGGPQEAL